MAAMTPTTTPAKGMMGMPAGRGGGLLAEDAVVVAAAVAAAVVVTAAAAAAYCWGCFLFIVKYIFVWYLLSVSSHPREEKSEPRVLRACPQASIVST